MRTKKKLLTGVLLAAVLAACVGQPVVTETPSEPTTPPELQSTPVPYPGPSGGISYPSALTPYPPGDQAVMSPAYPGPLQPYPAPSQPYPAPWQPQIADQNLQRGEAFVDSMDILVMESFPPQYSLHIQGALPTPCHQVRVEIASPDSQMVIQVNVYSVVDPNVICAQVLAPFDIAVPLQGLPTGKYTVVVNGQEAGSIEVP